MERPKIDVPLTIELIKAKADEMYRSMPPNQQALSDALGDLVMWGEAWLQYDTDGSITYIPFEDTRFIDVAAWPPKL